MKKKEDQYIVLSWEMIKILQMYNNGTITRHIGVGPKHEYHFPVLSYLTMKNDKLSPTSPNS
jgi:hypothetical protein